MRFLLPALLLITGCAALPGAGDAAADVLLLGEQHDAEAHRDLQEQWVAGLARRGLLGALLLEMAERGRTTAGLAPQATEAEVQAALAWNTQAWPWDRYRPAIMAAVRAGVPVLGANLPRSEMRAAMRDESLDGLLPGPALAVQQQAIRLGHCELLPESQIGPMTRVQIARDQAMAQAIASVVRPGKTVVLLAGAGHVRADVGVPRHLPATVAVRPLVLPPVAAANGKDPCDGLRQQFQRRAS